jgi:hypothetical protein
VTEKHRKSPQNVKEELLPSSKRSLATAKQKSNKDIVESSSHMKEDSQYEDPIDDYQDDIDIKP